MKDMKKNQIAINLSTNLISMALSMGINFWITPILINKLGLSAYGYIGIITNLISFFTVITYTLNSMVGRFYTVEFKRNNLEEANEYISTSLYTCLILAIILIPIIGITTHFLDKIILIDTNMVEDVKLAFLLSSTTFILGTILSVFSTGAYCCNRLDLSNNIKILASILRICILMILINLLTPKIWFISISSVIESIISIALAYFSFKILIPKVKFSIKYFKVRKAKLLLSSGLFNSIILMGTTLMSQISLLVGNRYIDSVTIGIYSSILIIPNTLKSISTSISSAFSPTTLDIYTKHGSNGLKKYSNKVVRFCGYMIGWPVSIAAALGVPVFSMWLNKDYSEYRFFFCFIMLHLVANLAVSQLNVVHQAINKLKVPAIFSIIIGFFNLGLAIYMTGILNMGLWGLGIANMISFTLRNAIFMPIYTAILTNQKWYSYFKGLIAPQAIAIVVYLIGVQIELKGYIDNLLSFLLVCFILTIIYGILVFISLEKDEKRIIPNVINKYTQNYRKAL